MHVETLATWFRLLQTAASVFLFRWTGDLGKRSPHVYKWTAKKITTMDIPTLAEHSLL